MTDTKKLTPEDVRKQLRETIDELEGLRDTVKMRAHLASMELKKKWEQLDKRFLEARDEVKGLRDDARDDLLAAAREGLNEIKKGLREVRDGLDHKTH